MNYLRLVAISFVIIFSMPAQGQTPVPSDAQLLNSASTPTSVTLPPTPMQREEPLKQTAETERLKSSEELAMEQQIAMADFDASLSRLIAEQRNPRVEDLTIDRAVQIALQRNTDILNAIQGIRLARGELIEVVSQAVPQFSITSGYTEYQKTLAVNSRRRRSLSIEIPNPNGGSPTILQLGANLSNVQNRTWNIQFQGSQLIFDGGATYSGIQAGQAGYRESLFNLRSTVDNVVFKVITQFYNTVLNRALIVAQQQNVALLQEQVKDQQIRFEAGTVPRFNVLQAEVQLANAKPPLIEAENNFRISLYQLVTLIGLDYPKGRPGEVPFNIVGKLGYTVLKTNPDESIRIAIARNPSLKAQRQLILANAALVNAQIAGWLPTINASGGYRYTNNLGNQDLTQTVQGYFFGATGNWNIIDGGATYGQVSQARATLAQSKNNYENSMRGVVLNVQVALSNLRQAQETIDATSASVVQAKEAVRLAQERLDAGTAIQLDVLNAQTQLLTIQTSVLQARYDYIAATASYNFELGLDTQYVESFNDPLERPLHDQGLNSREEQQFQHVTGPKADSQQMSSSSKSRVRSTTSP